MKSEYKSPEAWQAQVLIDAVHDLTVAVRSLEFHMGYAEGVQTGRWQGANEVSQITEVGGSYGSAKP